MKVPSNKQINDFLREITGSSLNGSGKHQELFGKIVYNRYKLFFSIYLHELVNCWLEKGFNFEALNAVPVPESPEEQGYVPRAEIWRPEKASVVPINKSNKTLQDRAVCNVFKDPPTKTIH